VRIGGVEGAGAGGDQAHDAEGGEAEHEALLVAGGAAADQRQAGVVVVHHFGRRGHRVGIEQARGRPVVAVVGRHRGSRHCGRVDRLERQVDGQVVLGVAHRAVVVLARAHAIEREGRVAHRVNVEVERGHAAARGQRVRGMLRIAGAGAVVRRMQRMRVRIHRVAEIHVRQRHGAACAGLRSDGRIDVLEATLGVGTMLEHIAVVLV
jgi:hypothetical protein